VTSPDLYPTLLEVAGSPVRADQCSDGTSFVPSLRGQKFERGPLFWYYPHYSNQGGQPAAAVRSGDWKMVLSYDGGSRELYNLRSDISEARDLSTEEPDIARSLTAELERWCAAVGAYPPRPNPLDPFADLDGRGL
jgi:arylsulfatase A-like enzyme